MLVYSKNPEFMNPDGIDRYIIGEAAQNCNLDRDNGASAGYHSGIEMFEKYDSFIIIKTSDYQDDANNFAYMVSDKEAYLEILKNDKKSLLEKKEFERLTGYSEKK